MSSLFVNDIFYLSRTSAHTTYTAGCLDAILLWYMLFCLVKDTYSKCSISLHTWSIKSILRWCSMTQSRSLTKWLSRSVIGLNFIWMLRNPFLIMHHRWEGMVLSQAALSIPIMPIARQCMAFAYGCTILYEHWNFQAADIICVGWENGEMQIADLLMKLMPGLQLKVLIAR